MKQKTKVELLEENRNLTYRVEVLKTTDKLIREKFASVLNTTHSGHSWYLSKDTVDLSWEEIFFRIGELNSDANYSCVIAARDEFRDELFALKKKIKEEYSGTPNLKAS